MAKYIAELIGTFFLVFTIGCVVLEPGAGPLAPLAIGSVLMVMIYAGGHISGAHFNPAVTLAVWLRGKCSTADVPLYMLSQVVGAIVAAMLVLFVKGGPARAATSPDPLPALLAELLFTFALAYVILNVATSPDTAGNSYFGLAIGFTVLAGAFAIGGISGGAFNPAVALGISIMGLSSWANIWIFLVGNFAGAALAAFTVHAMHRAERREEAMGGREVPAELATVGV